MLSTITKSTTIDAPEYTLVDELPENGVENMIYVIISKYVYADGKYVLIEGKRNNAD